jgi:hypothetical protein
MNIKQVIPGVYMIGGICGTGFLGANIYILINEDITVVDTGYPGREKQILLYISVTRRPMSPVLYSPTIIRTISGVCRN